MSAIATKPEKINLKNSTILIIDDSATNLAVAVDYLEESGFVVLVAQDGESGFKQAKYADPQLILLDVLMPRVDGFETCRRLKADAATKDIPVIFILNREKTRDLSQG